MHHNPCDRILEPGHHSGHVPFQITTRSGDALALLDLTGANAPSSGVPTDVLRHSRHNARQHFAEFVRSELPDVDGLPYESRFTGRRSVAVFDHAVPMLVAVDTRI